jgi:hypothetical protein
MTCYDNPQVTYAYGQSLGTAPPCLCCGEPVNGSDGYLALWAGTWEEPELIAVAHHSVWVGPTGDDWSSECADRLDDLWHELLRAAGAGVLVKGKEGHVLRWFLGDRVLDPGTQLEILTGEGRWLPGWLEYQTRPSFTARFYFPLAGWDCGGSSLALPPTTVVRIPR